MIKAGLKVNCSIEALCDDYMLNTNRGSITQREAAEAEQTIWAQLVAFNGDVKKMPRRRYWFKSVFDGSIAKYEQRSTILNYDSSIADIVWKKVDKDKMPLGTAVRIYREARIAKDTGVSSSLIDAFNEGVTFHESGGKRTKLGKLHAATKKVVAKGAIATPDIVGRKEFAKHIKAVTRSFVDNNIKDADEYLVEKIVDSFTDWVDTGLKDFLNSFDKLSRDVKKEKLTKIGSSNFNWACEVIGIRSKFGKPIDVKLVRRRHHDRIKRLHPDQNDGSEKHLAEYQSVNDAKDILLDYASQLEEK